jgi:hypothetical protein
LARLDLTARYAVQRPRDAVTCATCRDAHWRAWLIDLRAGSVPFFAKWVTGRGSGFPSTTASTNSL